MDFTQTNEWAEVDKQGRLILPPVFARNFGILPGARMRLEVGRNGLRLHRPISQLARLYLEPTNRCNLACRMCMRRNWNVELGDMSNHTFESLLADLQELNTLPSVHFGGIGEPLANPNTPWMVERIHALGTRTELVTNATLLTPDCAQTLIDAGLDMLWVSLDGARPESYNDVRLGAEFPQVLENLYAFCRARKPGHRPHPEIGIVFVAMRRNIADLPELLQLGKRLKASQFLVTNLLPYSAENENEILYRRSLRDIAYLESGWLPHISLPKIDFDETTGDILLQALRSGYNVSLAGNNLGQSNDVCTFIENGATSILWDGSLCPCPPLAYTHSYWLHGYERTSYRHVIGNIRETPLLELWNDPAYTAYRERVQSFGFAPCTFCGGCDISRANQSDCLDNPAPTCGGCLWAQALIRCP